MKKIAILSLVLLCFVGCKKKEVEPIKDPYYHITVWSTILDIGDPKGYVIADSTKVDFYLDEEYIGTDYTTKAGKIVYLLLRGKTYKAIATSRTYTSTAGPNPHHYKDTFNIVVDWYDMEKSGSNPNNNTSLYPVLGPDFYSETKYSGIGCITPAIQNPAEN